MLCISPALFYDIKLTVEFQEEKNLKSMGIACCFKNHVNMHKVQLIEHDAMAATVQGWRTALEGFALLWTELGGGNLLE